MAGAATNRDPLPRLKPVAPPSPAVCWPGASIAHHSTTSTLDGSHTHPPVHVLPPPPQPHTSHPTTHPHTHPRMSRGLTSTTPSSTCEPPRGRPSRNDDGSNYDSHCSCTRCSVNTVYRAWLVCLHSIMPPLRCILTLDPSHQPNPLNPALLGSVSPGADPDIYFPFSEAERRLTSLHGDMRVRHTHAD